MHQLQEPPKVAMSSQQLPQEAKIKYQKVDKRSHKWPNVDKGGKKMLMPKSCLKNPKVGQVGEGKMCPKVGNISQRSQKWTKVVNSCEFSVVNSSI